MVELPLFLTFLELGPDFILPLDLIMYHMQLQLAEFQRFYMCGINSALRHHSN